MVTDSKILDLRAVLHTIEELVCKIRNDYEPSPEGRPYDIPIANAAMEVDGCVEALYDCSCGQDGIKDQQAFQWNLGQLNTRIGLLCGELESVQDPSLDRLKQLGADLVAVCKI